MRSKAWVQGEGTQELDVIDGEGPVGHTCMQKVYVLICLCLVLHVKQMRLCICV